MGQIKPWQIVILVAAAVALATSAYIALSKGAPVKLSSELTLVDVVTGDRFTFDVGGRRAVMIPAPHPDTGKMTLLSFDISEDGRAFIPSRNLQAIPDDVEPKAVIDRKTGEIRLSEQKPRAGRGG